MTHVMGVEAKGNRAAWARVVRFGTTASRRLRSGLARVGSVVRAPDRRRRGSEPEVADTVEHTGADESQQTIDWLAELRAAGRGPVPAWKGEPDPDVRRMAQAIDEAVRAFRARLDEAVLELCGDHPEVGRAPATRRRRARSARGGR